MRKMNIRVSETSADLRKLVTIIHGYYLRNRDLPVDWTLNSDHISEVLRSDGLAQKSSFISRAWLE